MHASSGGSPPGDEGVRSRPTALPSFSSRVKSEHIKAGTSGVAHKSHPFNKRHHRECRARTSAAWGIKYRLIVHQDSPNPLRP